MNDTEDTISPLDDAIVEDGIEEEHITSAELSADAVAAFHKQLRYRMLISEEQALQVTIAWVRAGMP